MRCDGLAARARRPPFFAAPHRTARLPSPRRFVQVYWEGKYPSYECAGNFGVPAVTADPAKLKELETIELKHGRLAMIGIISFACAVSIPGSVPFYPF